MVDAIDNIELPDNLPTTELAPIKKTRGRATKKTKKITPDDCETDVFLSPSPVRRKKSKAKPVKKTNSLEDKLIKLYQNRAKTDERILMTQLAQRDLKKKTSTSKTEKPKTRKKVKE